jgi:hypothetical protein
MPFLQHDPPAHKRFLCSLVIGCVREYSRATRTLAPFSLAPTPSDITLAFTALHPKSNRYFPFFLEEYEPNQNFKFSFNSFKLAFQHMPHLLASGHYGMVFEHLQDFFNLEDLASGFLQLFQLCFHIVKGHIPLQIAHDFGAACLLTTKPLSGVHPIAVGGALYRFISRDLCIQFHDTLQHISP